MNGCPFVFYFIKFSLQASTWTLSNRITFLWGFYYFKNALVVGKLGMYITLAVLCWSLRNKWRSMYNIILLLTADFTVFWHSRLITYHLIVSQQILVIWVLQYTSRFILRHTDKAAASSIVCGNICDMCWWSNVFHCWSSVTVLMPCAKIWMTQGYTGCQHMIGKSDQ